MNQERIGLFIKRKRIEKGLTQDQLANLLYVSSKTISRWERGLNLPDISILESLSIELGVSVNEIMLGEENTSYHPNITIQYTLQEKILKIKKIKHYVLLTLFFSLILLLDVSFGYFSINLSWQIHDKTFFPHGILFSLLYKPDYLNNTYGIYLTQTFYIFIVILSINILFIIIFVYLSYLENKIEINSK